MTPIPPSTTTTSNPPNPPSKPSHTPTPNPNPTQPTPSPSKKRKRKDHPNILHTTTIRNPQWTYFHLILTLPSPPPLSTTTTTIPSLDAPTLSTLLTPPLTSYLGLTGASIPIDILCIAGLETHIRIPRDDAKAFRAALSSWTGSVDADLVPGCEGGGDRDRDRDRWGKVRVSWRVGGEAAGLGLLLGGGAGDGRDLFGG
ncbi:hypothetical protein CC80DRAFT_589669 [Byssothecium circinans]|uniref:Ribonucleases P/MRP subunit Pop8-like domain-containing protein n=1 Tax=Byssothecium circinans TaxID=147558 RepID=A0A6A5UJL0_9PLEO|nr:hypothetical protein CC80DRAFT_589669 [Byssothecium circinans]